jgi:hypothetical protein
MIEAVFGEWRAPQTIKIRGIDGIAGDPKGYKLVARARKTPEGIVASAAPEVPPPPASFLREARGAENRVEIELKKRRGDSLERSGSGKMAHGGVDDGGTCMRLRGLQSQMAYGRQSRTPIVQNAPNQSTE